MYFSFLSSKTVKRLLNEPRWKRDIWLCCLGDFFFLKFFDSLKVDSFANISCDASCSQEKLLRLPLHRWKMCYQRCPPPPITPVLLLQVSILIQQRVTQSQRSIFSHSATRSSIPTAVFLMSTSSCPSRITTTHAFS